jgi:putative transposase
MRKPYPTDLSDAEWKCIEPHLPAPKGHGRPRTHDLREIAGAIFYLLKTGCQWRLLPHDFPVEMAHRLPLLQKMAHREGTWERTIRERLRVRLKRDPQPSAGVVGSKGRSRAPRSAGRKMIRALRAARRSAVKART